MREDLDGEGYREKLELLTEGKNIVRVYYVGKSVFNKRKTEKKKGYFLLGFPFTSVMLLLHYG